MYEVILSPEAREFFASADKPLARKLAHCFSALERDPRRHNNIKRLTGERAGLSRFRVGAWRVIYRIDDAAKRVRVLSIANPSCCWPERRNYPGGADRIRSQPTVARWQTLPLHPTTCLRGPPLPIQRGLRSTSPMGLGADTANPIFNIFDVRDGTIDIFAIGLPRKVADDELRPSAVQLSPMSGKDMFLAYDPRKHPASLFAHSDYSEIQPQFADSLACQQCGGVAFKVAVGFEVPSDSSSPNDTSWFALAAVCVGCGAAGIVFDDETA